MNILFLAIYLVAAVISGCLLGVPIKDYIGRISWIDDSLEISSSNLSDGTCRIISVVLAVIIASCLFLIIKDSLESSIIPAIVCCLTIPLLIFVFSFILTIIGLALYWFLIGYMLIIVIIIVAFVMIFD